MTEVIRFLMKGLLKSKYLLLVPAAIIFLVAGLLIINNIQSGATQQELEKTFQNRKETVHLLITSTLTKERLIGLTSEEQQSLESLLSKEQYINEILKKVNKGNLEIAVEQLAYLKEYETYTSFKAIPYLGNHTVKVEKEKADALIDHHLPFTEENTPFKTALFTKQLFQILFSPVTAFLLIFVFCYKYMFDRENRTFDFFKINSLSNTSIYYGYLIPLLMVVFFYIFIVCFLAILPPLITGNINTIYYPLEVAVNSEIILVPVWKWLVFIPIGWGIFSSILLLLFICLIKQQAKLGLLFSLISLPVLISYLISLKIGFQMTNPIHLIVSYEPNLLTSNRFVEYLIGMLFLFILCNIIVYAVIRTKNVMFGFPEFNTSKKQYQSTGKLKLLDFELIKKKRKGHILFTVLLLSGFIGSIVIIVNQQFQTFPDRALKTIEDYQEQIINDQTHWKLVAEEFELEQELQRRMAEQTGEEVEILSENPYSAMLKQLENRFGVLEVLKGKIHAPDFSETYRSVMKELEPGSYKERENTQWNVTDMASEEQEVILEDKGITPWPLGNKWISNFEDPDQALDNEHFERLKLFQERNTKYDNSSLFIFYKLFDWNVMFVILLIFILILWTTMAEEHSPNPTINFLKTKPVRLTSIYIAKWVYNFAIASSLLLISGAVVFFFAAFIGGLGKAEYPILIYGAERLEEHFFHSVANNSYFYFESLAGLLVKSGILVLAQIFFLNSLFSFIGKLFKNHYAAIVVTIILVIAGYAVGNHYIEMTGSFYNPFVYFDTWNIIDGWKSIEAQNAQVNFRNGAVNLFISGSLLFMIGLLFRRRVAS